MLNSWPSPGRARFGAAGFDRARCARSRLCSASRPGLGEASLATASYGLACQDPARHGLTRYGGLSLGRAWHGLARLPLSHSWRGAARRVTASRDGAGQVAVGRGAARYGTARLPEVCQGVEQLGKAWRGQTGHVLVRVRRGRMWCGTAGCGSASQGSPILNDSKVAA